jgi:hypothetical protein
MKSDFHATDIYSAVWPLHFVSRIIGLAPYSIKPGRHSKKYYTFLTCFYGMWSIFYIIFLVALEYIFITGIIISSTTIKSTVSSIFFLGSSCSYSIITLFQSVTINRVKVREIFRKFSEIDQLFSSEVYRTLIYKNTRLFLTFQFAIIILIIIMINILFVYASSASFRIQIFYGFSHQCLYFLIVQRFYIS